MTKTLPALLLSAFYAQAQWVQDQFVIGAWWDPGFTGVVSADNARLSTFKNAHFNTLTGFSPTQTPVTGQLTNGYASTTTDNRYRLERIAAVGGLKMLVADAGYYSAARPYSAADINAAIQNYRVNLSNYTPPGGTLGSLRNVLMGYHVADEPSFINPDQLTNQVLKIRDFMNQDNSKLAWANLFGNRVRADQFFGDANQQNYRNYVGQYLASGSRVISFDNYAFTIQGTAVRIRDRFFLNHQIVADSARKYGANFWGFALSTENFQDGGQGTVAVDNDGPVDHRCLNEARMRFMAHVPVLYGAKGIIWHTYEAVCRVATNCPAVHGWFYSPRALTNYDGTPNSDVSGGNNPLFTWAQAINLRLKNMGPTLMRLRWLRTLHGSSTNNMATSGVAANNFNGPPEVNLPVVAANDEVLATNGITANGGNAIAAVGVFADPAVPTHRYLLVLNKDLSTSRGISLLTKPIRGAPALYDPVSNTWINLNPRPWINLNIPAGDMQLVRIDLVPDAPPNLFRKKGL